MPPSFPLARSARGLRSIALLLALGLSLLALAAYGPSRSAADAADGLKRLNSILGLSPSAAPAQQDVIPGPLAPQANGKIAFQSDRDGNIEIYSMDADGSGQVNLTNNAADDQQPSYSPDGSKIAFRSNRDGGTAEIYVMNADGSGQARLTNNAADDQQPAFSPDGSRIVFFSNRDGNFEIYVMNADGSGQTNLTNNAADDLQPSYSPDGSKITFRSNRDGNQEIYVMNADGSGPTRLTNTGTSDQQPAYSPDGSKITFTSFRDGNAEVYVMNADGSGPTRLTNNAANDGAPAYSPDGSKIAFQSNRDGNFEIYLMNADGLNQIRLTNNPASEFKPSWQTLLSCAPPPPNGVAWYRAEGDAQDNLGTNHGTLNNGATFAPGFVGQAFSLDGTDDTVTAPQATDLTSSFTFDAWIKPDSLTNQPVVFEKGSSTINRIGLQITSTGQLSGYFDSGVPNVISAGGAISAGSFSHVAFVLDDAGNQLRLYVNGSLVATAIENRSPASNSSVLTIGSNPTTGLDKFFDGLIDEFEIYNRALSATEVKDIYDAKNAGKCLASPSQLITVSNTNDSGPGSLRQAILDAIASPGTQTITFNIPGSGVRTINLASALPDITDPVIIDGYTQPGASANTLAVGNNAVLLVELNGTGVTGGSGLTIAIEADGSTVRGLVINRFGNHGINIEGGGNTIAGNFIGTDAAGTADLGNGLAGVFAADGPGNTVGGPSPAARNLISGNTEGGVMISGDSNVVQGNYIGTNAAGTAAISNDTIGGIGIDNGQNTLIGGTAAGAGNLISGNAGGITIGNSVATTNTVQGNFIGTQADGTSALANTGPGVFVFDSAGTTTIGGTAAGAANRIAFNAAAGVRVNSATGVSVLSNSIHSNGLLGIDLTPDGLTANDAGDGDTGSNNLQNFPVLTMAVSTGGNTNVQGTLNSTASTQFSVEFFSNPSCDTSGNGEGRTFLGSTSVTTDGSGNASINATLATAATPGHAVTATATDPAGNTSEFSQCRIAAPPTFLNVTGTYTRVVPTTGTYTISAIGADGGETFNNNPPLSGGTGAAITATFNLTAGDVLTIFVGDNGQDAVSDARSAGGGGGGSAVILNGTEVLIAAGGGGGGSRFQVGFGGAANTNSTAGAGASPGGAGGGGFNATAPNAPILCTSTEGGKGATLTTIGAFAQGYAQSGSPCGNSAGGDGGQGFGGGGGANTQIGGGGGGYKGGDAAANSSGGGGGGDSFVNTGVAGGTVVSATAGTDGGSPAAVDSDGSVGFDPAVTVAAPEMDVKGNNTSIADGDATPSLADHTDFGPTALAGGTVARTFTVENTGNVNLNLTGTPKVVIGGTHAADFTVTAQPASPVAASGSTTFTITFDPSAAGTRTATASIANNDSDENPYNFSIQGTTNPDYTVTTTGGAIVVTDASGNGDTLAISQPSAGNIRFAAAGRIFQINGGTTITGDSGNLSLTGVGSITVNQGGGNDTLNVGAFTTNLPNLTINGGTGDDTLNLNGDITFAADANLDADLQNDDATPGTDIVTVATNANLLTSGTGAITVKVSRNVTLNGGSSFETVNGGITVEANQQVTPTTGGFTGIDINGGLVRSTGTGAVTVRGRGNLSFAYGVLVQNGGDIIGGTSGTTLINGTVNGAAGNVRGVGVVSVGDTISSAGADVQVIGDAGSATGDDNYGVYVVGGGVVTAGGSGAVLAQGTGGVGGHRFNFGVTLGGTGAKITSNNGPVTVIGVGGGSNSGSLPEGNTGISVAFGGQITAGGANLVTVTGTGGQGVGQNPGVSIEADGGVGALTSGGGDIVVTGTGGGGTNSTAIFLNNATISTAANGGNVTLAGDSIDLRSGVSTNASGTVTLRPKTVGGAVAINLGGNDAAGTLGLTDSELDLITAGTIQIGDGNSGAITQSQAISLPTTGAPRNVVLTSPAGITVNSGTGYTLNLVANTAATPTTEADRIGTNGNVTLGGGTLNVTTALTSTSFVAGDTWKLFNWGTAPTGAFTTVNLPTLAAGLAWNTSDLYAGGTISVIALGPEMNVKGNSVSIADGDATPDLADHTDFGSTALAGGTVARTFTVENTGGGDLNLTGTPKVSISGTNAADFTVTTQPASPVSSGGGTTTFVVTFDPSANGLRTATVSIANNDADENPYDFAIQGTGNAAPTIVASGGAKSALSFDGVNDFTERAPFVGSGNFTFEFWFKANSRASFPILFAQDQSGVGTPAFRVEINSNNNSMSFFLNSSGGNVAVSTAANSVPQGVCTHYAIVRNGNTFTAYINGVQAGTANATGTPTLNGNSFNFRIGARRNASNTAQNPFNGLIDDFRIWTVARTAAEISANKDAELNAPLPASLLTNYKFNQGTPDGNNTGITTAQDATANGLNSTLNNFALTGTSSNFVGTDCFALNGGLTRQQGGAATNSTIATVSDAETPAGSLTVTATNVPTGISVTNIVNTNGTITADVAASCSATAGTNTVELTVTDGGGATATANLTVNVTAVEINVKGNNTSIADGDNSPGTTDDTDFGSTLVSGGTVSRTFTVENTGTAALNLTGTPKVNVTGAHASDFTVTVQPASPVAATNGTTTFTVQFDPSATGTRTATVEIANDDCDESPYDFAIQGTGTVAPEMDVKGNSTSIADGDTTPSAADDTDFGTITSGTVSHTFTIENTGTGDLNLTGTPRVVVTGAHASDFQVTAQPASPVAATNGTTTFTVQFSPTGTGTRTATLSIANDDADENPYDFAIRGTGGNTAPVVTVDNAAVTVNEGSAATNTGTFGDVDGDNVTLSASVGTINAVPPGTLPSDLTTGGRWRTASVNKSADVDGDNVYGTDGYGMWGLDGVETVVNPSYATITRNPALNFFPGQGGYLSIDDPTNPSGPQKLTGVIFNAPGAGNPTTFFTVAFTQARTVRMGILVDNADFAAISPATLRLLQTAGGTRDTGHVAAGTVASRNRSVDYYFFDINADAGDTFEVSGNADPGHGSNGIGGVFFDTGTGSAPGGTYSWSYTPPDGPDGPTTVTITATDDGNPNLSSNTTFTLNVNNVAPTIALTGDNDVSQNATYTLNLGAVTDPGTDTVTAYSINWGDGSTDNFSGNPASTTKTHTYTTGGSRTITVSLTDEDGTHSNAGTKNVTVNAAPTITAGAALARQQGTAASNSTVATVGDAETAAGSLTVTATSVPAGITVSNIVNTNGTVTADVSASCTATTGANTVQLTVTDGAGATATANLTVNVTANAAPTLTYTDPPPVVSDGSTTVNPATGPSDNGSVATVAVQSQGTYNGTISVNSSGVVSISNAAPLGTHTITIRATDNCGSTTDATFNLTVTSPPPAGTVQFSQAAYNAGEGAGTVTLTVTRTVGTNGAVTVAYADTPGTATTPADYSNAAGTVTFADGDAAPKTITININNDTLDEADETFTVALNVTSGGAAIGSPGTATVTITDDDVQPSVSVGDASVTEGDSGTQGMTFTVTLSAVSGQAVSVNHATADQTAAAGSDYDAAAGTVNIPAGSTSATFNVPVRGDLLDELDETFLVNLSSPTNATLGDGQGTGTINDDDGAPSLSVGDVTVPEGNSGTTAAVFNVMLSAASSQTVTANFSTADGTATAGSDYDAVSGTVNIPAGSTSATFNVAVRGDTLDEPDETFLVNLTNPTNATLNDGQGTGTIMDDDGAPSLSVGDVTVAEGNSGTTAAVFNVMLLPASAQTVTVNFSTADGTATAGSDYQPTTGTLTFNPGESSKPVTVQVIGDTVNEPDETFFLNLSSPSNATVGDGQGAGTITNDDLPLANLSVTKADSPDPLTVGGDVTYTITVTNNGPGAASGVTVTDALPAGVSFVSATPSQGGCSGTATITCNLGGLANGATATVRIVVTANTVGTLSNTANVVAAEADPDTSNNSATATTTVNSAPTVVISGRLTGTSGAGLSGLNVNLNGSQTATATTDANGNYTFSGLAQGGSYTVAPAPSDFDFTPPSRSFNNLSANQTADFAGRKVRAFTPAGQNVSVQIEDSFITYANVSTAGTTTVQPINPASAGTLPPGYALDNGSVAVDVTTTALFNGAVVVTLTVPSINDPAVFSEMRVLHGEGGTLVDRTILPPDQPAPSFATRTISARVTSLSPFVVARNNTNTISGRVTDASGNGVEGINLSLSGSQTRATTTDARGNYSFTNVPAGGNYTVTPSEVSYVFTPPSRSFNTLVSDQTADFTAAPAFFSISGHVTQTGGSPLAGATMTLSGAASSVTTTDANGNYSFTNVPSGGNYFVTADKLTFDFSPERREFNNLLANQTADFTGAPQPDPTPVPPTSDDFGGGARDPEKWNEGTLTQPAAAADPLVTVVQQNGMLVIQPRPDANGLSFNGYVSTKPIDLTTTPTASLEVVQPASGVGAVTTFSVGTDSENYYRFSVQDASLPPFPTGAQKVAGPAKERMDGQVMLFQTSMGGSQFSTGLGYNPTQHRFWRFRFDTPALKVHLETSPDRQVWTIQLTADLATGVNALISEIAAGTVGPTPGVGAAGFDNYALADTRIEFATPNFNALEDGDAAGALITVTRTGATDNPSTVGFATEDGTALSDSDYTSVLGNLRFEIGEATKTFRVRLNDDSLVEPSETVRLVLFNAVGGVSIGGGSRATLTILDDDGDRRHPLDDAQFFVRQHYTDFLNRDPDDAGLAFWTSQIESCGANEQCREVRRINVSAAFFLSIEFQETGYLAYRFYKGSYARRPTFAEFIPDSRLIGRDVVVGTPGWQQKLEQNKRAFAALWVTRQPFRDRYDSLNSADYVDTLYRNAGVTPTEEERTALIVELVTGRETRAGVLLKIVENAEFRRIETSRAFVYMQYVGYLRRDPDEGGYNFWLDKLNQFGGDFRRAEMVKAFISSIEYRERFGRP